MGAAAASEVALVVVLLDNNSIESDGDRDGRKIIFSTGRNFKRDDFLTD
jgi:hypothetical protein